MFTHAESGSLPEWPKVKQEPSKVDGSEFNPTHTCSGARREVLRAMNSNQDNNRADCPQVSHWRALLLGQLDPVQKDQLENHRLTCVACARLVQDLREHQTLLASAEENEDGDASFILLDEPVSAPPSEETSAGRTFRVVENPTLAGSADDGSREPNTSIGFPLPPKHSPELGKSSEKTTFQSGDFPEYVSQQDLMATEVTKLLRPAQAPDEMGRLGGYRILRLLGYGGMGVVFMAEDPQLGRFVAIKAIKPGVSAALGLAQRFLREARALAAVKHDNVVTVYQVGQDGDTTFLAMEYLQGQSLEDWMYSGHPVTLGKIIQIGLETALGLAAAHEKGLIHRDIKPANLWLEAPRQRVKILDFGLARPLDHGASMTDPGMVVGTPSYMAPEQAGCNAVDGRSDIFSLGCVLYHLCTGKKPFDGPNNLAILTALAIQDPPACDLVNPAIPSPLSAVVQQLMHKEPSDRPASALAVVELLLRVQSELGLSSGSFEVYSAPGNGLPTELGVRDRSQNARSFSSTARGEIGVIPSRNIAATPRPPAASGSDTASEHDYRGRDQQGKFRDALPHAHGASRNIARVLIVLAGIVLLVLGLSWYTRGPTMGELSIEGHEQANVAKVLDQSKFILRHVATGKTHEVIPGKQQLPIGIYFWKIEPQQNALSFDRDLVEIRSDQAEILKLRFIGRDKPLLDREATVTDDKKTSEAIDRDQAGNSMAAVAKSNREKNISGERDRKKPPFPIGKTTVRAISDEPFPQAGPLRPEWIAREPVQWAAFLNAAMGQPSVHPLYLTLDSKGNAKILRYDDRVPIHEFSANGSPWTTLSPGGNHWAMGTTRADGVHGVQVGHFGLTGWNRFFPTFAPARLLAFDSTEEVLVSVDEQGHILAWNIHTSARLTYRRTAEPISAVAVLPGGRQILTLDGNGRLRRWPLGDQAELPTIGVDARPPINQQVQAQLLFQGDDLLVATSSGKVSVLDFQENSPNFGKTKRAFDNLFAPLAFSPEGRYLAGCTLPLGTIQIIHWPTGKLVATVNAQKSALTALSFDHWGQSIVTSAAGEPAHRVDLSPVVAARIQPIAHYDVSPSQFVHIGFWRARPSDKPLLVTGSENDNKIHLRYPHDGHGGRSFGANQVRRLEIGSRFFVAAQALNDSVLFDERNSVRLNNNNKQVHCLAISPDQTLVAMGSPDGSLAVFDSKTADRLYSINAHAHWTDNLVFSPDSKLLYSSGDADAAIKVWDSPKGQLLHSFDNVFDRTGSSASYHGLAITPDGNLLVATSFKDTAQFVDLRPQADTFGKVVFTIWRCPASVAISPDGQFLASSGLTGIEIWHLPTQTRTLILDSDNRYRHGVFSPDGQYFAAAAEAGKVRVWSTAFWDGLIETPTLEDEITWQRKVANNLSFAEQLRAVSERLQLYNSGVDVQLSRIAKANNQRGARLVSDGVKNLTPLAAITDLQELQCVATHFQKNSVVDLNPLARLPLENLMISNNLLLRDIAPMRFMPLKSVISYGTSIRGLEPLRGKPLETLHFGGSRAVDLDVLRGMPLRELWLWETDNATLAPIQGAPLEILNIRNSKVADLSPLQRSKLRTLFYNNTLVTDNQVAASLPHLTELGANSITERDREWILKHPKLETLQDKPVADTRKRLEEDENWYRETTKLAPMALRDKVFAELRKRNPQWNGRHHQPKIDGDKLIEWELGTEGLKDLTPLRAMRHLQGLGLHPYQDQGTAPLDLTPLADLPFASIASGRRALLFTDANAKQKFQVLVANLAPSWTKELQGWFELALGKNDSVVTIPLKKNSFPNSSPRTDMGEMDIATGATRSWRHLPFAITVAAVAPGTGHLVAGGNQRIALWTPNANDWRYFKLALDEVRDLAITPDGSMVVYSNQRGQLFTIDPPSGKFTSLPEGTEPIRYFAVAADGKKIYGAYRNGVGLWTPGVKDVTTVIDKLPKDISTMSLAPDGKTLLLSLGADAVKVIDLPSGRERCSMRVPQVSAIAWHPGSRYVALGFTQGAFLIVDSTDCRKVLFSNYGTMHVTGMVFSADGKRLLVTDSFQRLLSYNVAWLQNVVPPK